MSKQSISSQTLTASDAVPSARTRDHALFQRYRESLNPSSPAWNDVLALLLDHRSVRHFTSQGLPDGTLEILIAAAQSASTSSNKQFWSVVAVENPQTKQKLAVLSGHQKKVEEAPLLLMWLADLSRIASLARERGMELTGLDYTESFFVGSVDATLAAQNAAVAAESLGLSVVYIGGMRNHPVEVAQLLELPQRCFAVFGMCVGYADPAKPTAVKPRLPQDAVLHRETYRSEHIPAAVERYESNAQAFRREQGQSDERWTEQIMDRVKNPAALNGRHELRQALATLGFPLK